VRISYHGTPASGYYNSTQIKHDLTTTITGALVLVLLFLLLCFRRWDTIPLLLLPVVFGTLFGLTMMYFIKGQFSLLALGIGGVVLGVAMSYVLHVLTHQKYVGDAERMLRDQVKPVWLGCLTTIGSFAGLIFIQTDLLQDFGLFAAFAILGTTLFSLTYLPQFFRKEQTASSVKSFAWIDRINTYPFDRKKPLLIAITAVMAVCIGAYFVGGTRFDADMHNLGYEAELTEHSEQVLRDKTYTGDKTKYFASKGRTMEEAINAFGLLDKKLDSLQQLGLVKSYTHTNQIFVPLKVQQERIDAWHRYWNDERLAKVRQLIQSTAPQAGLTADAFDTFFEAATSDYEPDALYEAKLIPAGYQSTLMEKSYDGNFLCFTSVRCANDSVRSSESDYIRICDAIAQRPELLVLDTYYYTTDTLMRMSEDFNVLQWLSMAFVFMVLLLSFHFNLKHTVLGFLPILLSWMIVLGAMVLFDIRFNLISIIISTFIFGIGVDYSIFVMDGLTHQDAQKLTFHKTAIFLSAVTLITTVSSMLIASHPAIRSVGFSTLVGLLSAVILSYVLQPAIYRWLNRKKA
jgi:predicted exporter